MKKIVLTVVLMTFLASSVFASNCKQPKQNTNSNSVGIGVALAGAKATSNVKNTNTQGQIQG